MLRFLSTVAASGEMFSPVNVDARTEVGQGRAGLGWAGSDPLNINLTSTNTLSWEGITPEFDPHSPQT